MRKVPTSVMVLSIIGLVLGAINTLGLLAVLIMKLVNWSPSGSTLAALDNDTVYRVYSAINLGISIPSLVLLIAACIGSLMLRRWARNTMNIYAWISIVHIIIGAIYTYSYLLPKMAASVSPTSPPGFRAGMDIGMYSAGCGSILSLVFPICILYFYSRPKVIDAFNGIFPATPAAPTNFPVEFPQSNPQP